MALGLNCKNVFSSWMLHKLWQYSGVRYDEFNEKINDFVIRVYLVTFKPI